MSVKKTKIMKGLVTLFSGESFSGLGLVEIWSAIRERINVFLANSKHKDILSLKSLIILGFVVAVIPLFLAVMSAAYGMRETSALGRSINSQVFEQTKAIRLVMQKTGDIERKAKLFVLFSDPALRKPDEKKSYESTRASFKDALNVLLKLNVDNKISLLVNELLEKENLIYEQIIESVEDNLKLPVEDVFHGLRDSSNNLSREFESYVDHEFSNLRQQSDSLERGLLIKGGILLLISFIFIALLIAILSRSIQQLDTAIRRLGLREFDEPVEVDGPSDLRYLGNRLEWLRTHLMDLELSKQQFMHNVALEIDIPLEDIRIGVERLANEAKHEHNPMQQELAQTLCTHVDRLKSVSLELIRFSQLSVKPEANCKKSINMKILLDSVIADIQSQLDAKSISLKKLIRPVELPAIPEQIRCIVEQLMSNAVKYSPIGGEIRIMLREAGKQMELEIEDEGPGIRPDERPHVFEPFFRGESGQSAGNTESLGLGLAIVKEYVTNHHGKIDFIDTRHDQNGARILVQIPITEEV